MRQDARFLGPLPSMAHPSPVETMRKASTLGLWWDETGDAELGRGVGAISFQALSDLTSTERCAGILSLMSGDWRET